MKLIIGSFIILFSLNTVHSDGHIATTDSLEDEDLELFLMSTTDIGSDSLDFDTTDIDSGSSGDFDTTDIDNGSSDEFDTTDIESGSDSGEFDTTDLDSGSSDDFDTTNIDEFDTTDIDSGSSGDFDTTDLDSGSSEEFDTTTIDEFDTTDINSGSSEEFGTTDLDSESSEFDTTDIDSGSSDDFDTTDIESGSESGDFDTTDIDSQDFDTTAIDSLDDEGNDDSSDDDATTGIPTQTADDGSDSVDDIDTTQSGDDSNSDSGDMTSTTTPSTIAPVVCTVPPTAQDSACECFDGQFVDGCPQNRCEISIVNNVPFCVDDTSSDTASNSVVVDTPSPTEVVVDNKSGSGSGSEDSGDNVAMIGKESENSDDLAKASESATVTTVIGILSAAVLLMCVAAIGATFYCRTKDKRYINMHALETVEMNGICEGNESGLFNHIVECKDSDDDEEEDDYEVKDTLIYGGE